MLAVQQPNDLIKRFITFSIILFYFLFDSFDDKNDSYDL